MSHTEAHTETYTETPPNPFSNQEMHQFDADDAEAGRAIGKMLSLFFVYTAIVMTVSVLATIMWLRSGAGV